MHGTFGLHQRTDICHHPVYQVTGVNSLVLFSLPDQMRLLLKNPVPVLRPGQTIVKGFFYDEDNVLHHTR